MTIHVISFDFDGCLFHRHYHSSSEKDVIASNQQLLEAIKSDNLLYSKTIALILSNRQSQSVDEMNALKGNGTVGSCFPAILKIAAYLEAKLDSFLLADLYGDLPHGTSFTRALDALKDNEIEIEHAEWLFDETKVTILYAQMQKIANEYPDQEIVFDAIDDLDSLLSGLKIFFTEHKELIPPNVALRLNFYAGDKRITWNEIKNPDKEKGFIDANYLQTVKDMAKISIENEPGRNGKFASMKVAQHVTPALLQNRIPLRKKDITVCTSSQTKKVADRIDDHFLQAQIFAEPNTHSFFTASKFNADCRSNHIRYSEGLAAKDLHDLPGDSLLYSERCGRNGSQGSKFSKKFPDSYTRLWEKVEGDSHVRKIKALLLDYTKDNSLLGSSMGRIASGHWNRHYVSEVNKILSGIINQKYTVPEDIIADLKVLKPVNGGSLSRRIAFIEAQIADKQNLNSFN